MRRRFPILLLFLLLVLAAAGGVLFWFLSAKDSPLGSDAGQRMPSHSERSQTSGSGNPTTESVHGAPHRTNPTARAERDALRDRIVAALAAAQAGEAAAPSTEPSTNLAAARRAEAPRPAGTLRDRIGGRESLAAQLNKEFMPLADECIELVQKDAPELSGMLVIGIETAADEELGAVVEDVKVPATNQVTHPELLTCLRETALSLRLPPPPKSGREKFEISVPIKPRSGPDM
jgi:hypothetical protein